MEACLLVPPDPRTGGGVSSVSSSLFSGFHQAGWRKGVCHLPRSQVASRPRLTRGLCGGDCTPVFLTLWFRGWSRLLPPPLLPLSLSFHTVTEATCTC